MPKMGYSQNLFWKIAVFFLVIASMGFASDEIKNFYFVKVENQEKSIVIYITSSKVYPVAGYLKVKSLELELPENDRRGYISAEMEPESAEFACQVVGPDRGHLEFFKGISLPKISLGKYLLVLDSQVYGVLHVTESDAFLKSFIDY